MPEPPPAKSPSSASFSASFQVKQFVEFRHTDMAGIVHFTAFLGYMETAEHALLRHLGLSVNTTIDEQHFSFPRVSVTCDFHTPAFYEDNLDIEVSISSIGTKSIAYSFQILRDGTNIATGAMTCVCCIIESNTPPAPTNIPAPIVELLKPYVREHDSSS